MTILLSILLLITVDCFAQESFVWTKIKDGADIPNDLRMYAYGHDKTNGIIFLVNLDNQVAYKYLIETNQFEVINATNWPNENTETFLYDPLNDRLLIWRSGTDDVYALPANGGSWIQIGNGSYNSSMYGSKPFWNPISESPGLMNGYGFYAVHNWVYELQNNNWIQMIPDSSNDPWRRASGQVFPNEDNSKLFLFSGQGKQNGSQYGNPDPDFLPWATDIGVWNWYKDLWELDLETYDWTNILPYNSDSIESEGIFAYHPSKNTFLILGGFIPPESHGGSTPDNNNLWKYNQSIDTGFVQVEQSGEIPPIESMANESGVKQSFYDPINDNIIFFSLDHGIWLLDISSDEFISDFVADTNSGHVPLTVNFIDTSTPADSIVSWQWDFDNDGIIDSNEQNPEWVYSEEGQYTVSLTISDGENLDIETKINYITVSTNPNSVISIDPSELDFGNVCINETATIPIYVHNYGQADLIVTNIMSSTDRFSVSLPQRDINFTIASMDSQLVNVSFSPNTPEEIAGNLYFLSNDPNNSMLSYPVSGTGYNLEVDFSVDQTNGDAPLDVQFTDASTGDIQNWNWDFGDGNSSILQNPNHIYETDGIYSVTLYVEDNYHQKSLTQENLITVIGHPILSSPDSLGINFGSLYLTDSSGDSLIVIHNIGTMAFQIDALSFVEDTGGFNFTYQNMGTPILPAESDTIVVNFYPPTSGSFNDHILINNTSENLPNYEISLSGFCEYAPPAAPDTVYIEIIEPDAIVSWNPVTENIYGASLTPDGYLVFFSADPGEEDDNYFFLSFTTELSHTHEYVVEYSPQMFYKVYATVNLTRDEIEYFTNLNNSKRKLKKSTIKQELKSFSKFDD